MPQNKCQHFNCLKITSEFFGLGMLQFPKDTRSEIWGINSSKKYIYDFIKIIEINIITFLYGFLALDKTNVVRLRLPPKHIINLVMRIQ